MPKKLPQKNWGPDIFRERERRGWSQQKLADLAGTNQATIDRLETGQTKHSKYLESVLVTLALKEPANLPDGDVEIVGRVGAGGLLEGHFYATGQGTGSFVRRPRNWTQKTVAAEIYGGSLGPAFNGWLVFYNDQRFPPAP